MHASDKEGRSATGIDLADLENTAKEALRDLSHIELHLEDSKAPTTILNRAVDVRLCIKELRDALARATPQHPGDLRERFDSTYLSLNGFHTKAELTHAWGALAGDLFRAGAAATPQHSVTEQDVCAEMRALCSACGGTGDVHSIDGEWRGSCDCQASTAASEQPTAKIPMCETCDDPAMQMPDGSFDICQACIDFADAAAASEQPERAVISYGSPVDNSPASEQQASVSERERFNEWWVKGGGRAKMECWYAWQAALSGRATIPSEADERALFEQEANAARFFPRELDFTMAKSPSGRDEYANSHLQSRWEGWRAGRALTHRATKATADNYAPELADRLRNYCSHPGLPSLLADTMRAAADELTALAAAPGIETTAGKQCVCDSPAWCKQYGKCHRAVCGFNPAAEAEHDPEAKHDQ